MIDEKEFAMFIKLENPQLIDFANDKEKIISSYPISFETVETVVLRETALNVFHLEGTAEVISWYDDRGVIEMNPETFSLGDGEVLDEGIIKKYINDGGFGTKNILSVTATIPQKFQITKERENGEISTEERYGSIFHGKIILTEKGR